MREHTMTGADRAIRWSTISAVVVVAAVAASFSYQHALDVVGAHGRQTWMNNAFPLTVDGLIYAGSMVLLNDARRGLKAHPLAYIALGLGISATLTVNVMSGLTYGPWWRCHLGLASRRADPVLRVADDHRPPVGDRRTRAEYGRTRAADRTQR
jgi:hypothetical protein